MPLFTRIIKTADPDQTAGQQRRFTTHGSQSRWRLGTAQGSLMRHQEKPGGWIVARRPGRGR